MDLHILLPSPPHLPHLPSPARRRSTLMSGWQDRCFSDWTPGGGVLAGKRRGTGRGWLPPANQEPGCPLSAPPTSNLRGERSEQGCKSCCRLYKNNSWIWFSLSISLTLYQFVTCLPPPSKVSRHHISLSLFPSSLYPHPSQAVVSPSLPSPPSLPCVLITCHSLGSTTSQPQPTLRQSHIIHNVTTENTVISMYRL